jgi:transcriptional regulator with XRE-family HTH domain
MNSLRDARRNEGWSQEALADAVGVTREHISMVENGRRPMSLNLAERWAAVVGGELDEWDLLSLAPSMTQLRDVLTDADVAVLSAFRDPNAEPDYEAVVEIVNRLIDAATPPC